MQTTHPNLPLHNTAQFRTMMIFITHTGPLPLIEICDCNPSSATLTLTATSPAMICLLGLVRFAVF
jgi:hypothetical protein